MTRRLVDLGRARRALSALEQAVRACPTDRTTRYLLDQLPAEGTSDDRAEIENPTQKTDLPPPCVPTCMRHRPGPQIV